MSETRALSAALSGPVFHGAASRSALQTSARHVDRWAPEGERAAKGSGMRSLAFADRLVSPWIAGSNSAASRMFASYASDGMRDRATPEVSWLFPRPWFQDELDWMAAARQGLEETPRAGALTTRGTFIRSDRQPERPSSFAQVAMPVLAPPVMAAVAPSMRASALPESNPLAAARMWSPGVPFAAAAAAEVVAGAVRAVEAAGLPGVAERSPIWSGLAVVRPSEFASEQGPSRATPSLVATPVAPARVTQVAAVDAARASIERIDARVEVMRASVPGAVDRPSALPPTVEVAVPTAEAASPVSQGEHRLADAARSSTTASSALRTVELLLQAVVERTAPGRRAGRADELAPSGATGAAPSAATSATEADAASSVSGVAPSVEAFAPSVGGVAAQAGNFAPAAGPRVAMAAGLGGLVRSIEAARALAQPMVRTDAAPALPPFAALTAASAMAAGAPSAETAAPSDAPRGPAAAMAGFSPVWAARPTTALGAVASSPARSVDHLTWSDRWLARFAGASPLAMQSFDHTAEAPSLRPLAAGAPEVVYVHPALAPESISAAAARAIAASPVGDRPRAAPAPVVAAPTAPLRIDDGEAVSDAIFAAIAAAPARRATPAAPSGPTPTTVTGPAAATAAAAAAMSSSDAAAPARAMAPVDLVASRGTPSIADLASISAPTAPDAGLAAALASSPLAPALASVMPMTAAPVFDPRALRSAAVAEAYLGGLIARAAAPIGVLSGAPTAANLAQLGAADVDGGNDVDAPSAWSARDLALAPVQLRLAAAAPDRTFVALGGDVPVALRASRADASVFRAPPAAVGAASSWATAALPPAALAAMAAAAASPSVVSPSVASPSVASPSVASVVSPAAAATSVDAATDAGASSDAAADAPFATMPAAARAAVERELVALRSAVLASSSAATSVPLVHAANAPLVSATTAVPSIGLPHVLPALAGVGAGESSPLGAAMARHSAAQFDGDDDLAMPLAIAAAPFGAARGPSPVHAPAVGGRPGSLAEAALAWSIAESRSAGGLSFDFVTPEMVLAARVYGLPAGAAAEAMRVAAGGSTAMASLAASLDLTFLRAFHGPASPSTTGAVASSGGPRPVAAAAGLASPSVGALAADAGVATSVGGGEASLSSPAAQLASIGGLAADPAASPMYAVDGTFSPWADPVARPSVGGRTPRGAYLWPSATSAALGLHAMSPEGDAGLPVVALELLAAQAVAELGTWVTAMPRTDGGEAFTVGGVAGTAGVASPARAATAATTAPAVLDAAAANTPAAIAARAAEARTAALTGGGYVYGDDAAEAAATATAWAVPTAARQRFETVYVALARTSEGQSLSPSARAARAMSLLTRGDGETRSTRQLAAEAWSVLPHVYRGDLDVVGGFPGVANDTDGGLPAEVRPGLAGLAARAGDLLGSFVAPTVAEVERAGGAEPLRGPASRAEAPVYVENNTRAAAAPGFGAPRPGRAYTQFGGGESEVPGWFEAAAQRMLNGGDDRAASTLAQMVLVTAMPSQQIAAATKGGSSSGGGGGAPQSGGAKQGGVEKPDVEKLALEVYQEVLTLFELNRMRGGDQS